MTIVRRASPLSELVSLRQAMDRLFEDSFVRPRTWTGTDSLGLPLDVTDTPDSLIVGRPAGHPSGGRRDHGRGRHVVHPW